MISFYNESSAELFYSFVAVEYLRCREMAILDWGFESKLAVADIDDVHTVAVAVAVDDDYVDGDEKKMKMKMMKEVHCWLVSY